MDAADTVDNLGDSEIDDDACECECLLPLEPELATHQIEHAADRFEDSLVEILVESEGNPGCRRESTGCGKRDIPGGRRASVARARGDTRSPSVRPRRRPGPRARRRLRRARPPRRSGAEVSILRPALCSRCCRPLPAAASSSARPARPAACRGRRETVAALPRAPFRRGRHPLPRPAPIREGGRRGQEAAAARLARSTSRPPMSTPSCRRVPCRCAPRAPRPAERRGPPPGPRARVRSAGRLGRAGKRAAEVAIVHPPRAAEARAPSPRRASGRRCCLPSRSSGSARARARNSRER